MALQAPPRTFGRREFSRVAPTTLSEAKSKPAAWAALLTL
jgi:hypothetical protein